MVGGIKKNVNSSSSPLNKPWKNGLSNSGVKKPVKLKEVYAFMLSELQLNRLEVVLVPSQIPECAEDGGMIRAVCSENVGWYKELCRLFPRTTSRNLLRKKPSTRICRRDIEVTLARLAKGKKSCSQYAPYLKDFAIAYLEDFDLTDDEMRWMTLYGELPEPFTDQF